mmetsp:Transcript_97631/g.276701  ORF Transcript_97631/g.276701 Transcript_97631/m.276701 type:complete len:440 (-) Transcript_97631:644-1963(-)
MGRARQHLEGRDVRGHVGRAPGHERPDEGEPDGVEGAGEQHEEGPELGPDGPLGDREEGPDGLPAGPRGHDGVGDVAEDDAVEGDDRGEQGHDEAVEGPLVPEPDAVVDPGAVVVKAADAAPAVLAVVGPQLLARAADDADLLEAALVEELEVLAPPMCHQPGDPLAAEALTRLPRALAQLEGGAVQLLAGQRQVVAGQGRVHEGLQLRGPARRGAAGAVAAAAVFQAAPGRDEQLALEIIFVLLQLQPLDAVRTQAARVVRVQHLRLDGLLRVESVGREAVTAVRAAVLREHGLLREPAGVSAAGHVPKAQGDPHQQEPHGGRAGVLAGDPGQQDAEEDQHVEGGEAQEEASEMALREVRPPEDEAEELTLVEVDDEVPVLLPHGQVDGRVAGNVRHVKQVHGADVDEHVGDELVALQRRPVDGRHALVVAVRDVRRP